MSRAIEPGIGSVPDPEAGPAAVSGPTSAGSSDDGLRWSVRWPQVVLAIVFILSVVGLVANSIQSAARDRESAQAVAVSDSASGIAVYTQRESLVLSNRVEQWLLGEVSRRDVQIQRALLERRLEVLDPLGQDGLQIAGSEYRDALAALDAALVSIPTGVLAPEQRAEQAAILRPVLDAFEEESTQLASVYQALVDSSVRSKFHDHSTDQQRSVLLLTLAALSGLALLVVTARQIRNRYSEARRRIRADRDALDRASVLERGEADILAGIVAGRASDELVADVLDLAHDLSGRCLRFVRADRGDLSGLPPVSTHRLGPPCVESDSVVVERRWPVMIADGDAFGELQVCAPAGEPVGDAAASTDGTDAVARRCADLVALVIDRAIAVDHLRFRATHDPLTGMPNRAFLLERIAEELDRRSAGSGQVAAVFCDLDRFKLVNDTLGHRSGDRLLRAVARRLESVAVGDDVLVARLGGDEFVALCVGVDAAERAEVVADAMAASLEGPFLIDGSEVFVSGSLGVAVSGDDVSDAEQLLRNSDVAMYRAKADPHVRVVAYDEGLEADLSERLLTDAALRRGLRRDDFIVHLQPIVEVATGHSCGVEALVRWRRNGQIVYPGAFLQLAQDNGLMPELGRIVISRALDALEGHRAAVGGKLTMWINLAKVQLRDPAFPSWLHHELARRSLPPSSIVLELSEGDLLDVVEVGAVLDELRSSGIRIAMDDFGTGYSSLVRLGKLPIDVVKLDREFVSSLGTGDHRDFGVLAAAVKFVGAVGLDVVVEGIERQVELDAVAALGCRYVQGFLLRRPAPADEILAELAARERADAALVSDDAPAVTGSPGRA